MPSNIYDQVQKLLKSAKESFIDLNLRNNKEELTKEEVLKIYDIFSSTNLEDYKKIQKSIKKIEEKIALLPKYRNDHESDDIEKFESYIAESIVKLVKAIDSLIKEYSLGNLTTYTPSWLMPVDKIDIESFHSPEYEILQCGKTTGRPVIKKTQWIERELAPNQAGIIIGVVTCGLHNWDDSRVTPQTLQGVQDSKLWDNLEVFDSLHEFERIYRNRLGMAMVRISKDNFEIQEENISSVLDKHLDEEENISSLKIFIIADSTSLSCQKKTASSILDYIPFAEIKKRGIEEIELDLVSCTSADKAAELIGKARTIARMNNLCVTVCCHNGYIFNNIVCAYMNENDYERISESGKVENVPHLDSLNAKLKKSKLVEILVPGFSSIYAQNSQKLAEYICEKEMKISPADVVRKKIIIRPMLDEIDAGKSFKYTEDGRVKVKDLQERRAQLAENNDLALDQPAKSPEFRYLEKMIGESKGGYREA